jgi:hypothetical protein
VSHLNLLHHSPLAAYSLTWSNENEEYVHTVCTKADARANWWWWWRRRRRKRRLFLFKDAIEGLTSGEEEDGEGFRV